jgi:hypothetical protein
MSNVSILLKYISIINKFAFVGKNEVLFLYYSPLRCKATGLVNKKIKFFYRLVLRQNN